MADKKKKSHWDYKQPSSPTPKVPPPPKLSDPVVKNAGEPDLQETVSKLADALNKQETADGMPVDVDKALAEVGWNTEPVEEPKEPEPASETIERVGGEFTGDAPQSSDTLSSFWDEGNLDALDTMLEPPDSSEPADKDIAEEPAEEQAESKDHTPKELERKSGSVDGVHEIGVGAGDIAENAEGGGESALQQIASLLGDIKEVLTEMRDGGGFHG